MVPTGSVSGSLRTGTVQSVMALHTIPTTTLIQNVIVVVSENQTFDALFGDYQPPSG